MEQLQQLLNQKFEEMVSEGFIEELIKKKLESCMDEVFTSVTRSYGTLTQHFEKQIEEAAGQGIFSLDLESYNDVIASTVKQKVASHFKGLAQKQIADSIDEMLQPIPKEITLQEMINLVQKAYQEDDYDNDRSEYLSFECEESSHGWFDLKFWKNKETTSYSYGPKSVSDPDIELHVNKDGEIRWLKDGKSDYGAHNYNVESTFYRMTIARTKITDLRDCDQDDFENTYIGIGEDY